MDISYTQPLWRAWDRAKGMLFRPFRIETWLVLGASAFLTQMLGHSGMLMNWNGSMGDSHHRSLDANTEAALDRVRETLLRWLANPAVLAAIAAILIVFAVAALVLAWVAARAEFVFLDGVAVRRARFLDPWRRSGKLGRSLFLWRAAFSFAWLLPILCVAVPFSSTVVGMIRGDAFAWPPLGGMIVGCGLATVSALAIGWVNLLMDSFVVPLMYRHDEHASQAWMRFLPLLGAHAGEFVAFTVFTVVLAIGVGVALTIAGVGTCCVGLVLMIIPYVGSVVLLPVTVTARALGPLFLAQFGPEWAVFPPEPVDDEETPATPV